MTSQAMSLKTPRIGLKEDLRPNAFLTGYGSKSTIVFSLGLLKLLNEDELTAVVSHELAHLKSKDFLLATFARALNILSFYNPLSHLATINFLRERELLADETGVAHLKNPKLLENVLFKLEEVLKGFDRENLSSRIVTSMFVMSPFVHRPNVLSTHPQAVHRVFNIKSVTKGGKRQSMKLHTIILLLLIVSAGTILSVSTLWFPGQEIGPQVHIISNNRFVGGTIYTDNPPNSNVPPYLNGTFVLSDPGGGHNSIYPSQTGNNAPNIFGGGQSSNLYSAIII